MFNWKEENNKVRNYLIMKNPQLGRCYLLLKIHKRTSNIPGRPVISSNGTATENISAFLDFHLKNIVSTIPHFRGHQRLLVMFIGDILEMHWMWWVYIHIYLTNKVLKLCSVSPINVKTNLCHQKVSVN